PAGRLLPHGRSTDLHGARRAPGRRPRAREDRGRTSCADRRRGTPPAAGLRPLPADGDRVRRVSPQGRAERGHRSGRRIGNLQARDPPRDPADRAEAGPARERDDRGQDDGTMTETLTETQEDVLTFPATLPIL